MSEATSGEWNAYVRGIMDSRGALYSSAMYEAGDELQDLETQARAAAGEAQAGAKDALAAAKAKTIDALRREKAALEKLRAAKAEVAKLRAEAKAHGRDMWDVE